MGDATVAVTYAVGVLRDHGRRRKDGSLAVYDEIERRLSIALRRDLSGSVLPDGWPAATEVGRTGRGGSSSVERAMLVLIGEDPCPADRHRQLTRRAMNRLLAAVSAVEACVAALDSIDELVGDASQSQRTCEICTGKRGMGGDRPIAHRGTVGDRLERAVDACDRCYQFITRSAAPASRAGYLPTDEQIRRNEEHGRWRMRAS